MLYVYGYVMRQELYLFQHKTKFNENIRVAFNKRDAHIIP